MITKRPSEIVRALTSRNAAWAALIVVFFTTCRPKADTGGDAQAPPVGSSPSSATTLTLPPLSPGARIEDERNTIGVFRSAAQSTVYVTQTRVVEDYYAGTLQEVPAGSGSGFVWDDKGIIVTNYHVVECARSLTVTFQDQQTVEAKIVGLEPRKDIAVLKVEAPPKLLVPIRVAKGGALEVGQKAMVEPVSFRQSHSCSSRWTQWANTQLWPVSPCW